MSGMRERMNRLRGIKPQTEEAETDGLQFEEAGTAGLNAEEALVDGSQVEEAQENGLKAKGAQANDLKAGEVQADGPKAEDAHAVGPRSGAELEAQSLVEANTLSDDAGPEWAALGVRLLTVEAGECLERRLRLPLSHRSGIHQLDEWLPAASRLKAFHPESGGVPTPGEVLFLDLETTGLGGGTGNVAFMMGLAYYESDAFVIRQFLIRHPAEELAMLTELELLLSRFRWLATYNGRSFDWPLVQTRLIMNGLGRELPELLHLDFLHPSRSIWKNTLTSCRLSHVEEERLGIFRLDDVPGSLAPTLYFRYLAEGDPAVLEGVFRHNEQDMVSLACLGIRFGQLLGGEAGSGFPMPEGAEELLRTGLWLERMGEQDEAERLFALLTKGDFVPPGALHGLAMRDKKAGNWERAVVLWQKAAAGFAVAAIPDWQAHVELAMYYEHKGKNFSAALDLAEEALVLAVSHPLVRRDARKRSELEALRRRRDRLLRKFGAAEARLEAGR
ncbi:ribonuclease H-like domain-containing protein [Paenibacillus herberti]|nr:ribonuclease H-like domain-containing protein [Paenibacillus herberti]